MEFAITYIYKDCKKTYMLQTNLDLEHLGLYYLERYIKRMKYFQFDCIIDFQECVSIKDIDKLPITPLRISDNLEKQKQTK